MIKRITGRIAALGIVALVVFTALGYGNYRSMLPGDLFESGGGSTAAPADESAAAGAGPADDDAKSAEK